MQRMASLLVGVLTAWLGAAQAQVPDYIIQLNAAPLKAQAGANTPAHSAAAAAKPAVAPVARGKPRIGVLLPLGSPRLGEAAEVVRQGVEAAAAVDDKAEVLVLAADEESVAARYQEALAAGVNVVIGPLTRPGIAAVAPLVKVPTLALNTLEPGLPTNPKLFGLALAVEGEAQQVAGVMFEDGRRNPLVVASQDVLSARLRKAFVEQWQAIGGKSVRAIEANGAGLASLPAAAAQADAVFLAVDDQQAGAIRQALPPELPVYATSQLNSRHPPAALNNVRLIDMPWFLMPQHEAVKRYPRPDRALTMQTERLYALGIDAYRLAVLLANPKAAPATLRLDGVTGDLQLGRDRQFTRQLPLAVLGAGGLQ
ncbi:MAG: penicillin-binding protein activator [Pseudogulbenkiania sp.]|nr:penicillin-binding protein activator [Pseudogulbenkiania sp.]